MRILIVLLVIASFLIGTLWTKVQYLEKTKTSVATGNQVIPPSQTTPSQKAQPQSSVSLQRVKVDFGHLPVKGKKDAKVTIVEFGDFRCPFCDRFFKDTEPLIIKNYVDTGKVKFAFRHFEFLGPASVVAGNAAECAQEQDKFWQFHDYLYQNQPEESDTSMYTTDKLTAIAVSLGLNGSQFKSCLADKKYDKNVADDLAAGRQVGVNGTPTTFINGLSIVGAEPYSTFKTIIDQELSQ